MATIGGRRGLCPLKRQFEVSMNQKHRVRAADLRLKPFHDACIHFKRQNPNQFDVSMTQKHRVRAADLRLKIFYDACIYFRKYH